MSKAELHTDHVDHTLPPPPPYTESWSHDLEATPEVHGTTFVVWQDICYRSLTSVHQMDVSM